MEMNLDYFFQNPSYSDVYGVAPRCKLVDGSSHAAIDVCSTLNEEDLTDADVGSKLTRNLAKLA